MRAAALLVALAVSVACATAIDDPNWVEVRTPHVHLVGNVAPAKAVDFARRLEVFRELLRQISNFREFDERVPTYLFAFKNASAFHAYSSGRNVLGYLNPTPHGTYMAFYVGHAGVDPFEVLQHEYTHYLQYNQAKFHYPPWYVEGLAEMLSTVRLTEEGVEIGRIPQGRARFMALASQRGYWHPLRRVLRERSLENWPPIQVSMFYGEAWALTHFLHAGHLAGYPNRLNVMQRYLEALDRGESHDEAFPSTFHLSESKLERELIRYLNRGLPYLSLPRADFDVTGAPEVRPLREEQKLVLLGDLALQFTFDEEPRRASAATAERAFRRAIEIAPDLALAHAGLALARKVLGSPDAEQSFARALELAPDDPMVCLYAAEYLLPIRGFRGDPDRSRLARAREILSHGLGIASENPALHVALGRSFLLEGEDPAQAIAPLVRSQQLLRWDMEGAVLLGEAYAETGAHEKARIELLRVVNGTHDERQRKRANELLARLESEPGGASKRNGP